MGNLKCIFENSNNVHFGQVVSGGPVGCNKSNPHFLSTTVWATVSTIISLCTRNGRPRIMGAHKPGTMIVCIDFKDQKEDRSCNCNLTYSEN